MNRRITLRTAKLLLCLSLPLLLFANPQAGGRGRTDPAASFRIGMGARPAGMGGAFVALADDENAVFYNPAGLAFRESSALTSLWSSRFGALSYGAVGFAGPGLGLEISLLHSGGIEVVNEFGRPTGETFGYLSGGGLGAVALSPLRGIAIGGKLKYYGSALYGSEGGRGGGWSVSPALLVKEGPLRFGLSLEELLNRGIAYSSGEEELWARSIRIGLGLKLELSEKGSTGKELNLAGDLRAMIDPLADEQRSVNLDPRLGMELWFNSIGLRIGLNRRTGSCGASLRFDEWKVDWSCSAYFRGLPPSQRISVTLIF